MNMLGKIPEADDTFEYKGYQVTVLSMEDKCVEKVLVKANQLMCAFTDVEN